MPNEHVVKSYAAELEQLSTKLALMGGHAETQVAQAIEAISRRDSRLAEKTLEGDRQIDAMEHDIETTAIRLIALRQPMGVDLRHVLSAIKMASDLERIGDLAKNVAKRSLVLNREQPVKPVQGLARMGRQALAQLKDVLDAYAQMDADRAGHVRLKDEDLDELYNSLFRELLTYMMEEPRTIGLCTHLLFIAKNLERIGDHATNIAEYVHYTVHGEYIMEYRPKGDVTSFTCVTKDQVVIRGKME